MQSKTIKQLNRVSVAIVFIGLLLAVFIGFLLIFNYNSLQRLRGSSLKQYQYELEQRSLDVSHLLSDQNHNILELSTSEQIQRYFENKALGMSMKYGLQSSINSISKELKTFVLTSRHGNQNIFSKLVFYDMSGNVIADSGGPVKKNDFELEWRQKIGSLQQGYYVFRHNNKPISGMFYVQPFIFKGNFKGTLILWYNVEVIGDSFLNSKSLPLFTGIIYPPERLIISKTENLVTDLSKSSLFLSVKNLKEIQFQLEQTQNTLLFEIPLSTNGFKLVEVASAKTVLGGSSPITLLIALALLGVTILGAMLLLMKITTRNIALQTRIAESSKREEVIEQKNKQLKAEIKERERAEKARIELEAQLLRVQKMEAIGMLAGGVAHDLNNILSGIVSYPELLLADLSEESPMRKPLSIIQQSGLKASAIVADLLTLARRGVAVTEVLNLNQIIIEYLQSPEHVKILEVEAVVKVNSILGPDLLNITGSPIHLSKTIMNLVSNAIEACTDGGTIVISTENRYLDRPLRGYDEVLDGEYAIVKVVDEGVGISPEDLERIFEPFYTKKKMGRSGTGLGMAVVWGAVKDHHGYIEIQSTLGIGTEVVVFFPVTRQDVEIDIVRSGLSGLYGNGQLILVVDDIEEQRLIAKDILEKSHYKVVVQPSGEEAIRYLRDNPVDLVILDMIMEPGIDGLTTYQEIQKIYPLQKVLITSGYSETERVKEALRIGGGGYIGKPYTIRALATAAKNVLATSENVVQS